MKSAHLENIFDSELHDAILSALQDSTRISVVSTNSVMKHLRSANAFLGTDDDRLAGIVSEKAVDMGLIPVFDPSRATSPPPANCKSRRRLARLGSRV